VKNQLTAKEARRREVAAYMRAAGDIYSALVKQLRHPDKQVVEKALELSLVVLPMILPEEYAAKLRQVTGARRGASA
jgi:hypothetical protein